MSKHLYVAAESSQAIGGFEGRMYDYITIVTADGITKTLTFDITNFYGRY